MDTSPPQTDTPPETMSQKIVQQITLDQMLAAKMQEHMKGEIESLTSATEEFGTEIHKTTREIATFDEALKASESRYSGGTSRRKAHQGQREKKIAKARARRKAHRR
jgi:hypothetical protein